MTENVSIDKEMEDPFDDPSKYSQPVKAIEVNIIFLSYFLMEKAILLGKMEISTSFFKSTRTC